MASHDDVSWSRQSPREERRSRTSTAGCLKSGRSSRVSTVSLLGRPQNRSHTGTRRKRKFFREFFQRNTISSLTHSAEQLTSGASRPLHLRHTRGTLVVEESVTCLESLTQWKSVLAAVKDAPRSAAREASFLHALEDLLY